eukprot:TRINITY_DN2740_c0_g1_i1.p1 TRINITY_DN2740_c0_g1~~TRINITY_DN2740_c0_g1_i1.p1  ORF type:complete len:951 (-),score=263.54 TRINITY_DN2740_c0_g1_i1:31-2883(-)
MEGDEEYFPYGWKPMGRQSQKSRKIQSIGRDEDWDSSLELAATPRNDRQKAELRERELAELRRLVQHDERFGRALNSSCVALHEVVESGNPSPVLAIAAGLVWRSLCIAWELEGSIHVPKARLRARLVKLEEELAKVSADLQRSRSVYLKELTGLRDQVRRLDDHWLAEAYEVVYEEEPVMYYEPIQYLEDSVKEHIAQIVEEKLKLALSRIHRLQNQSTLDMTNLGGDQGQSVIPVVEDIPTTDVPTMKIEPEARKRKAKPIEARKTQDVKGAQADVEAVKAAKEEASKAAAELQALKAEASKAQAAAQAQIEAAKAAEAAAKTAAQKQSEKAAAQLESAVKAAKEEAMSAAKSLEGEAGQKVSIYEAKIKKLEGEVSSLFDAAKKEWEDLTTLAKSCKGAPPKSPPVPEVRSGDLSYVKKLLEANGKVRKDLLAQLEEAKAAKATAEKARSNAEAQRAEAEAQQAKQAKSAQAKEAQQAKEEAKRAKEAQEAKNAQQAEEAPKLTNAEAEKMKREVAEAQKEAENQRLVAEEAVAKLKVLQALMNSTKGPAAASNEKTASEEKAASNEKTASEEKALVAVPEKDETSKVSAELARLGSENRQLRKEVKQLQQALADFQSRGHAAGQETLQSSPGSAGQAHWTSTVQRPRSAQSTSCRTATAKSSQAFRLPPHPPRGGKVHERLFLESYDRKERRQLVAENVRHAEQEKALELFQAAFPWWVAEENDVSTTDAEGTLAIGSKTDDSDQFTIDAGQFFLTQSDWGSSSRKGSRSPSPGVRTRPLTVPLALMEIAAAVPEVSEAEEEADMPVVGAALQPKRQLQPASPPSQKAVAKQTWGSGWAGNLPPRTADFRPGSARSARPNSAKSLPGLANTFSSSANPVPVGARGRPSTATGSNTADAKFLREGYRILSTPAAGAQSSAQNSSMLVRSATAPNLRLLKQSSLRIQR